MAPTPFHRTPAGRAAPAHGARLLVLHCTGRHGPRTRLAACASATPFACARTRPGVSYGCRRRGCYPGSGDPSTGVAPPACTEGSGTMVAPSEREMAEFFAERGF